MRHVHLTPAYLPVATDVVPCEYGEDLPQPEDARGTCVAASYNTLEAGPDATKCTETAVTTLTSQTMVGCKELSHLPLPWARS
mmetsp:Transcript_18371/g.34166  ORF Transcript_18371/g.34166 Transcript_18371/m.34166 type:complete len:83 (+) Transcript_18371:1636-1884(+)